RHLELPATPAEGKGVTPSARGRTPVDLGPLDRTTYRMPGGIEKLLVLGGVDVQEENSNAVPLETLKCRLNDVPNSIDSDRIAAHSSSAPRRRGSRVTGGKYRRNKQDPELSARLLYEGNARGRAQIP